jgi:hypothetical protein
MRHPIWTWIACLLLADVGALVPAYASDLSAEDQRQIRALVEVGKLVAQENGLKLRTVVNEDTKLTASDAASGDRLGISVALSGDTVLVGAYRENEGGSRAGSAYVFTRNGTSWYEQAKLIASDAANYDEFGFSVALSGDTALVGAHHKEHGGEPWVGSAYVFVRNGTTWSEQAKLTASDAASSDSFGISVALSGDIALVGAYGDDHAGGVNAGSVYVFVRDGTDWSEQVKLTASDAVAMAQFGQSVALLGDTALVGAPSGGTTSSGSAYVFVRDGTRWPEQAKLAASDTAADDWFGVSVALSGDTALVGANLDDHAGGLDAGSAYVFVRNGVSWSEQAKLTASDAEIRDRFGVSVALSGDTALVGANLDDHAGNPWAGSAYAFFRSGADWFEQPSLTASDEAAEDQFGVSLTLSGDTAVVGAPLDNVAGATGSVSGSDAGSAYVFELSSNHVPVALCLDVAVSVSSACTGDASIDAGSFDPDGDPVTVSQSPPGPYVLGDNMDTFTVTDDLGASGSCSATVTVEETTAPQFSLVRTPGTLWPPNHHMVDVETTVIASDNCGTPTVVLASLTSNEADDAPGDGDGRTTGDIQLGIDDFHFRLRAERASTGSGRIYSVVYTATDGSGNAASATRFIAVPHDQNGLIDPVVIVLGQGVSGTVVSWAVVPDAQSYDVIRGDLNNVLETGEEINLGTVVCIEANSMDESTLGWEDGELPQLGKTFFYLVEYDSGISSSYGTESAPKPRVPGLGDCQ